MKNTDYDHSAADSETDIVVDTIIWEGTRVLQSARDSKVACTPLHTLASELKQKKIVDRLWYLQNTFTIQGTRCRARSFDGLYKKTSICIEDYSLSIFWRTSKYLWSYSTFGPWRILKPAISHSTELETARLIFWDGGPQNTRHFWSFRTLYHIFICALESGFLSLLIAQQRTKRLLEWTIKSQPPELQRRTKRLLEWTIKSQPSELWSGSPWLESAHAQTFVRAPARAGVGDC